MVGAGTIRPRFLRCRRYADADGGRDDHHGSVAADVCLAFPSLLGGGIGHRLRRGHSGAHRGAGRTAASQATGAGERFELERVVKERDYRGGGGIRTLPRPPWDYTQWNFFELLVDAKTGSVDLAVEGYQYPTYVDKKAHNKGAIALQLHAQPNEVQYKDLAVEVNPTVMKLLTAIPGKMPGKTPSK